MIDPKKSNQQTKNKGKEVILPRRNAISPSSLHVYHLPLLRPKWNLASPLHTQKKIGGGRGDFTFFLISPQVFGRWGEEEKEGNFANSTHSPSLLHSLRERMRGFFLSLLSCSLGWPQGMVPQVSPTISEAGGEKNPEPREGRYFFAPLF